MKAKIGVALVVALLVFYLVIAFQRGWLLIGDPNLIAKGIGLGMLLLPIVGAWALIRELLFGMRMQHLARLLESDGGLPPDTLERTPSGRIIKASADDEFDKYRSEAEVAPDDWRSWFRLSCAYDASGDRKRARATMRKAIGMHRRQSVS